MHTYTFCNVALEYFTLWYRQKTHLVSSEIVFLGFCAWGQTVGVITIIVNGDKDPPPPLLRNTVAISLLSERISQPKGERQVIGLQHVFKVCFFLLCSRRLLSQEMEQYLQSERYGHTIMTGLLWEELLIPKSQWSLHLSKLLIFVVVLNRRAFQWYCPLCVTIKNEANMRKK